MKCPNENCTGTAHTDIWQCNKCGKSIEDTLRLAIDQEMILANKFLGRAREASAQGNDKAALQCYQHALKIARKRLHPFHKFIGKIEDALAHTYCQLGDYGTAAQHCILSIEIVAKIFGEESVVKYYFIYLLFFYFFIYLIFLFFNINRK